jgi:hypothetical protein
MDTIGIIVGFGPAALILGSIGWVFMRLTFPEGYTVKGLFIKAFGHIGKEVETVYARKMEHTFYYCHDIKERVYKP